MDAKGELVITEKEKAEVLNNFLASVFTAIQVSHVSHFPKPEDDWGRKVPVTVKEEQV